MTQRLNCTSNHKKKLQKAIKGLIAKIGFKALFLLFVAAKGGVVQVVSQLSFRFSIPQSKIAQID